MKSTSEYPATLGLDQPPNGSYWIHEIKHDGYRILAQRALIAFKGEDMIFSPESSVNDPRPRLDPEEHETYVKKLTENLTSKDRWTLIFARMQLIRLGRYKDESQSTRLRLRSSSCAAPL